VDAVWPEDDSRHAEVVGYFMINRDASPNLFSFLGPSREHVLKRGMFRNVFSSTVTVSFEFAQRTNELEYWRVLNKCKITQQYIGAKADLTTLWQVICDLRATIVQGLSQTARWPQVMRDLCATIVRGLSTDVGSVRSPKQTTTYHGFGLAHWGAGRKEKHDRR